MLSFVLQFLSYTLFVQHIIWFIIFRHIICNTHHLSYREEKTSFVLHCIFPALHFSYTSFFITSFFLHFIFNHFIFPTLHFSSLHFSYTSFFITSFFLHFIFPTLHFSSLHFSYTSFFITSFFLHFIFHDVIFPTLHFSSLHFSSLHFSYTSFFLQFNCILHINCPTEREKHYLSFNLIELYIICPTKINWFVQQLIICSIVIFKKFNLIYV